MMMDFDLSTIGFWDVLRLKFFYEISEWIIAGLEFLGVIIIGGIILFVFVLLASLFSEKDK